MNADDNEHVHIHEMRGFMADDLGGALHEAYGISRGTRCKKFLYSLSLNPPSDENVPVSVFEAAIERIEQKLGFAGQPRAIIFHEKKGRRHAHVVWSRINAATMTAIDPYQDKLCLNAIGRELFMQQGWAMPDGYKHRGDADPFNYTHAQHSQCNRAGRDPKELKKLFAECWQQSDSRASFASALKEHRFILAKGDRRAFVAVDAQGEVYSIARWVGVKTKDVRFRLGASDDLPNIEEALKHFDPATQTKSTPSPVEAELRHKLSKLEAQRLELVLQHRTARIDLRQSHETRRLIEIKSRASRLPSGLRATWLKLSGGYQPLLQKLNAEAEQFETRDRDEVQALIEGQLQQRRLFQKEIVAVQDQIAGLTTRLDREHPPEFPSSNPAQKLVIPPDPEAQSIKERVNDKPETILNVLTRTRESFTRNDILRALAQYIDDPLKLGTAINEAMQSPQLVILEDDASGEHVGYKTKSDTLLYNTRKFQALKADLADHVEMLVANTGTFASSRTIDAAIKQQNKALQKEIGASLSEQQEQAIRHCLRENQLSALVGLAGTGKSTILSAVRSAYEKQDYQVHGATLSGKAADGLEKASGINSRTLASWLRSWEQGNNLLTRNDVLIIDEAGMIGTQQLLRFVNEVHRAGAKLIVVGDPEQLQPINAGTPFHDICDQIQTANLTEIHRQTKDWQKQASLDLAEQRTEKALDTYEARKKITEAKDTSEAIIHLVEDYLADRETNGDTTSRLALAHRRKDVHAINQAVRAARKSAGELNGEVLIQTNLGKRAFAKGDRIVFTKNDYTLNVRNGLLGTVKSATKDELVISLDDAPFQTIRLNPKHFTDLDHGYAITIHKSQGATVDRSFILGSTTMDRHLTYVAMTRHRQEAKIYGDKSSLQKMRRSRNHGQSKQRHGYSRHHSRGLTFH